MYARCPARDTWPQCAGTHIRNGIDSGLGAKRNLVKLETNKSCYHRCGCCNRGNNLSLNKTTNKTQGKQKGISAYRQEERDTTIDARALAGEMKSVLGCRGPGLGRSDRCSNR